MNPVGANLSHQLAQKQVQDARLLAQDTKKGQVTTATTVGRAVNQTTQDVKQATVEVPKEKVSLSSAQAHPQSDAQDRAQLGPESDVGSLYSQAPTQPQAQPEGSRSSEALMGFSTTLFGLESGNKKELEEIITQSAGVDTSGMAVGDSGREVALAATALRSAVSKLQAKMPGATAEQIREAAKSDPEVAKWASVADSANSYLSEIKAETQAAAQAGSQAAVGAAPADAQASSDGAPGAGASVSEPGAGENPFKLDPEKQAQMMAENVKTMEAIQNIYAQMWAEIQKARAQRHQLMMETATAINAMLMESHVNRMKSSENHRKAVMSVILENYK